MKGRVNISVSLGSVEGRTMFSINILFSKQIARDTLSSFLLHQKKGYPVIMSY